MQTITLSFSKKEYKSLLDLVFLGEYMKNGHTEFSSWEALVNDNIHILTQRLYKAALTFNGKPLVEEHPAIKDLYLPENAGDLEDYF